MVLRQQLVIMPVVLILARTSVSQQSFPVIEAVAKGHAVGHEQDGVVAVRAALAAGGNANERDQAGWTPLMHAALECRAEIVKLLLENGADAKLRGASGSSDFMQTGQTALLIASGCFIARRRAQLAPERHMPDDYAAYELAAPARMVRDLLARGGDVTTTDDAGRTPLMMAVMQGWPEVVTQLLQAHADVNARDHAGRRAIDYADPGNALMVSLLRQSASQPASGHSGRVVCDAERALDQRGFGFPITDCIAGRQLRAGLIKFQQQNQLQTTGELDRVTLKALGVRP